VFLLRSGSTTRARAHSSTSSLAQPAGFTRCLPCRAQRWQEVALKSSGSRRTCRSTPCASLAFAPPRPRPAGASPRRAHPPQHLDGVEDVAAGVPGEEGAACRPPVRVRRAQDLRSAEGPHASRVGRELPQRHGSRVHVQFEMPLGKADAKPRRHLPACSPGTR
jgi:hypothetical protein